MTIRIFIIWLILTVFVLSLQSTLAKPGSGQSPPFYNGSFRALGEIIWTRPSEGDTVKEVRFFEELYDSANLRAALRFHSANKSFTYIQDIETNQTFLYSVSGTNASCRLVEGKPDSHVFGPLVAEDGRPRFYLRDLLTSKSWKTTAGEAHFPARNMSCDVWSIETEHDGKPLVIAMAVNGIDWESTTDAIRAPASVIIRYVNSDHEDEVHVNIFSFTALDNIIHDDLLQLPDGVFCGGYKKTVALPPIQDMKVFDYHAEMLSLHDGSVHFSDVWIDMDRMLYRIDYKPSNNATLPTRTLIVSGNEDALYTIVRPDYGWQRCFVASITDLEFDVQMLADPGYIKHLKPAWFFSGNDGDLKLTYKKQTAKRGIPCHMWETLRTDWPPDYDGITTLWEWCFVVPKNQEIKGPSDATFMVSLDLTVLQVSSGDNPLSLVEGQRFSYNFYDSLRNPPELIDLHGFDISPCYGTSDQAQAYLQVKVSPSDYATLSSAPTLSDPKFLSAWRTAIDRAASLSDHSLRVTKTKGYFSQNNELFVTFVLLDRFPAGTSVGITDRQVNLDGMKENLQKAVDENRLGITYNGVNLTASSWSLGAPFQPAPTPKPPGTTSEPTSDFTSTAEVETHGTEATTAAADASTISGSTSTDSWEIITFPPITSDDQPGAETTAPTYDVITDLPPFVPLATRYASGVVGGTTVGLFVLGTFIGASATYVKCKFFPTVALPGGAVFHR